ncbi:hypothetical protein [Desulfogranum marinum]|uniref:hypothetical protein n=1 Tax=Desulfogranum marinum TaxID=453220 RepID=UPI001963543C|nr:hypothetical protein [Desulfogranum marinum]MBM9511718.1 hypothetical protein [Desulfogranum marinum]
MSFDIPENWHATVIFKNYLFFEKNDKPAFDIKWQPVQGRFSSSSILKQLSKADKNLSLTPWELPDAYTVHLNPYQPAGFKWDNNTHHHGILLYHASSRIVIILRFLCYQNSELPTFTRLLHTLTNDTHNGLVPWAVFDIQALLPSGAILENHEFYPGKYSIVFSLDRRRLVLLRFKPAAELLRSKTLTDFGAHLAGQAQPVATVTPHTAQWSYRSSGWQKVQATLARKPRYRDLHLSHHIDTNIILGILIEGHKPLPPETTQHIIDNYRPYPLSNVNQSK